MAFNIQMYDGVDYRYSHTDAAREDGLAAVAHVLRLAESPHGEVLYDLWFYSGGIGVLNRLAITLAADPKLWSSVGKSLRARTPEESCADVFWEEQFIWLLTGDERPAPIRPAAVQFINNERREFQSECALSSRILFGCESNVNSWDVVWGDDMRLNYLGYDQG